MDITTIKKLNKINLDFYKTVATDFDDTRQYFWQGWNELITHCKYFNELKLLDLGCGNGRFYQFMENTFPKKIIDYLGIDSNEELLKFAQEKFSNRAGDSNSFKLQKIDVISSLIEKKDFINSDNFNVVVSFGVFHHIPSYELRIKLLNYLKSKTSDDGVIIISLWQFMEFERFRKKISDNELNLEKNDYILDWKRGEKAYRYCHFIDENEQNRLIAESDLELIDIFKSDGKEKEVNTYLVLKKK